MINQVAIFILRGLVMIYRRLFKPVLKALSGGQDTCRFDPSCSQYFLDAIEFHGPWKGVWIGIHRIFRCHPWGGFGYDPVSQRRGSASQTPTEE